MISYVRIAGEIGMPNIFSSKYLDLKIRKQYLWGMIKTRRLVRGFDVPENWREADVNQSIKNMLIYDKTSDQLLISTDFSKDFPTWRPFRVFTQVRLLGFILFALPEWLDNILTERGFHDHWQEVNQIGEWFAIDRSAK